MPLGNGSITNSNSEMEKGQEFLYIFMNQFFFCFFLCLFFSTQTLLSLPAFHCAPQFSAVALAILMGGSAVLSLIGWERIEGGFTGRAQVSKEQGRDDGRTRGSRYLNSNRRRGKVPMQVRKTEFHEKFIPDR